MNKKLNKKERKALKEKRKIELKKKAHEQVEKFKKLALNKDELAVDLARLTYMEQLYMDGLESAHLEIVSLTNKLGLMQYNGAVILSNYEKAAKAMSTERKRLLGDGKESEQFGNLADLMLTLIGNTIFATPESKESLNNFFVTAAKSLESSEVHKAIDCATALVPHLINLEEGALLKLVSTAKILKQK